MTTPNLASAGVARNSSSNFRSVGGRVPSVQYPAGPSAILLPNKNTENKCGRPFPQKPRYQGNSSTGRGMFLNGGLKFPNPAPRLFEQLHAERIYLLKSLQEQNDHATELLRKITDMEETMTKIHRKGDQRKLSKRLGYHRNSLRETTGQEKAILGRLGELTCEIQMRERMTQIENERQQHEQILSQLTMWQNSPQMQMNQASPGFYPYSYPMPYPPWQQQYENVGYFWPQSSPSLQYILPSLPAQYPGPPIYDPTQYYPQFNNYNIGTIPEEHQVQTTSDAEDEHEPVTIQPVGRTVSLSQVWSDLTYSATNTTYCAVPVLKRHSVPTESAKEWLGKGMD